MPVLYVSYELINDILRLFVPQLEETDRFWQKSGEACQCSHDNPECTCYSHSYYHLIHTTYSDGLQGVFPV